MKIIPLSEGRFTVDKSKHFIPFDENQHNLQARPAGSLLVEIQPFLVITSHDIFLLDTGLGFGNNGTLQIHQNLAAAGINAADITSVLLTHLHKDHAGALCRSTAPNELSFPHAVYYVQERELSFALEKGSPSFIPEQLNVLKHSSRVVLLNADEGTIGDSVQFKVTGAHSPFHQVFWIKENEQTIFFGGDDAPQLQQMKHRFVAKYDYDGKKAMNYRHQWWQQGQQEHWTFLFYHDVKNPVIQL
jgi:glyoxylase-like metal-dependent hydrolase (beta-lactamase superfamily II)